MVTKVTIFQSQGTSFSRNIDFLSISLDLEIAIDVSIGLDCSTFELAFEDQGNPFQVNEASFSLPLIGLDYVCLSSSVEMPFFNPNVKSLL
jgi:hypothetical protein